MFQDDDVALVDILHVRFIEPVSPEKDRLPERMCEDVDGRIHEAVAHKQNIQRRPIRICRQDDIIFRIMNMGVFDRANCRGSVEHRFEERMRREGPLSAASAVAERDKVSTPAFFPLPSVYRDRRDGKLF